jgi:hypothetical protein
MLVPDRNGAYRLVPVQPQATVRAEPPPRGWNPASAAGCIPNVDGPGAHVGPPPGQRQATPQQQSAAPSAFSPGWHAGVNPNGERTRRLFEAAADGRVAYYTAGGRRYDVSEAAWLRWAEGGV